MKRFLVFAVSLSLFFISCTPPPYTYTPTSYLRDMEDSSLYFNFSIEDENGNHLTEKIPVTAKNNSVQSGNLAQIVSNSISNNQLPTNVDAQIYFIEQFMIDKWTSCYISYGNDIVVSNVEDIYNMVISEAETTPYYFIVNDKTSSSYNPKYESKIIYLNQFSGYKAKHSTGNLLHLKLNVIDN